MCDYIAAVKVEVKQSDHCRKDIINVLTMLAKKAGPVNLRPNVSGYHIISANY